MRSELTADAFAAHRVAPSKIDGGWTAKPSTDRYFRAMSLDFGKCTIAGDSHLLSQMALLLDSD